MEDIPTVLPNVTLTDVDTSELLQGVFLLNVTATHGLISLPAATDLSLHVLSGGVPLGGVHAQMSTDVADSETILLAGQQVER